MAEQVPTHHQDSSCEIALGNQIETFMSDVLQQVEEIIEDLDSYSQPITAPCSPLCSIIGMDHKLSNTTFTLQAQVQCFLDDILLKVDEVISSIHKPSCDSLNLRSITNYIPKQSDNLIEDFLEDILIEVDELIASRARVSLFQSSLSMGCECLQAEKEGNSTLSISIEDLSKLKPFTVPNTEVQVVMDNILDNLKDLLYVGNDKVKLCPKSSEINDQTKEICVEDGEEKLIGKRLTSDLELDERKEPAIKKQRLSVKDSEIVFDKADYKDEKTMSQKVDKHTCTSKDDVISCAASTSVTRLLNGSEGNYISKDKVTEEHKIEENMIHKVICPDFNEDQLLQSSLTEGHADSMTPDNNKKSEVKRKRDMMEDQSYDLLNKKVKSEHNKTEEVELKTQHSFGFVMNYTRPHVSGVDADGQKQENTVDTCDGSDAFGEKTRTRKGVTTVDQEVPSLLSSVGISQHEERSDTDVETTFFPVVNDTEEKPLTLSAEIDNRCGSSDMTPDNVPKAKERQTGVNDKADNQNNPQLVPNITSDVQMNSTQILQTLQYQTQHPAIVGTLPNFASVFSNTGQQATGPLARISPIPVCNRRRSRVGLSRRQQVPRLHNLMRSLQPLVPKETEQ